MSTNITDLVTISKINGNVDRGGWQCQFDVLRDTDALDVNQHIDIPWWGVFAGNPPGMPRVAFSGYVIPSRFSADRIGSVASFTAETSDGFLRRGWLQGIGFAEVDARANYHQFSDTNAECATEVMGYDMTMGKMVKHILGYYDSCNDLGPEWIAHTNMVYDPTHNPNGWISLDDVEITPWSAGNPDGSMAVTRYIVRETDNVWSRLQEIAKNEFFQIYFDKTDTLHYQKHPMYLSGALPDPVMTFDEDFGIAPLLITPRSEQQVRQVILHAVTDAGSTLHSEYPTSPTHVYGKVEERSRVRCNSQATLDEWCERLYLYLNRDYTVRWTAPGLCGLLFELLDRVQVTWAGTAANGVHVDWDEKKFWIHDITVNPNDTFSGTTTFTLEAEST